MITVIRNQLPRIILCGALLGAVSIFPVQTHAAEVPYCTFEPYFEELALIEADRGIDYLTALRAELQVRKDLLRTILDCAIREADELALKLHDTPLPPDADGLHVDYTAQAAWAADYYRSAADRIDTLGILGSKDLAREILTWRTSNFLPFAQRATNLITWAKNDDLVHIARERYVEVERALRGLKIVEYEELATALSSAEESLHWAEREHEHARGALATGKDADFSFVAIKATLEALGEMYEYFFALSEAVSAALPQ